MQRKLRRKIFVIVCVFAPYLLCVKKKLILPYRNPFAAIGANVNIFSAGHKFFSKLLIIIVMPDLFK